MSLIEKYKEGLAHRFNTFNRAIDLFFERNGSIIVETGMARIEDNWVGDGMSTIIFADLAHAWHNKGIEFHSVELLQDHVDLSRKWLNERDYFRYNNIYLNCSDSVQFLRNFRKMSIDLLYLDSLDFVIGGDPIPAQNHALREYIVCEHLLHENSIILIDDVQLPYGGKGGRLIPFLMEEGWKIELNEYQCLLVRK